MSKRLLMSLLFIIVFGLLVARWVTPHHVEARQKETTLTSVIPSVSFIDSGQSLNQDQSELRAVASGDLDLDGDLDVFIVASGSTLGSEDFVLLNDGHGTFKATDQRLGGRTDGTDVALGDLNSDGLLDAVVTNLDSNNAIYLNQGQGEFTPQSSRPGNATNTEGVALGDMNGDGQFDIVLTGSDTQIWLNSGAGQFTDSNLHLAGGNKVAVADIDHNTKLDIIIAEQASQVLHVYRNLAGVYSNTQNLNCPQCNHLALGDLNGDQSSDVVVAAGKFGTSDVYASNLVFFNDGNGTLIDSGQALGEPTLNTSVGLADLNNDGALDVLITRDSNSNFKKTSFWLNDGAGVFTTTGVFTDGYSLEALAGLQNPDSVLGDFDSDNDLDTFVIARGQPAKLLLNTSNRPWVDSGQVLDLWPDASVALGDLDGDGHLDAFVGRGSCGNGADTARRAGCTPSALSYPAQVWRNDGTGVFTDTGLRLGDLVGVDVTLGDVTGDGQLDAWVANRFGDNALFINQGQGMAGIFTFTLANTYDTQTNDVSLGDLDGDGDLDAVLARGSRGDASNDFHDHVWLNNGQGNFTDTGQILGNDPTIAGDLGDIDNDGDLDYVQINNDDVDPRELSLVWLNDGTGHFTNANQALFVLNPQDVALGDFNGDGALDAYIANGYYGLPDKVLLNDGTGRLEDSGQVVGLSTSLRVEAGDIDHDGDLDVTVFTISGLDFNINQGQGNFTWVQVYACSDCTDGGALGDLNHDGYLDVFRLGFASNDSDTLANRAGVWLNTLGQYHHYALSVHYPDSSQEANFYANPVIHANPVLSLTYTLSQTEMQGLGVLQGYYSFNGGGQWFPAQPSATTLTKTVSVGTHTYGWDIPRSGFFGASDNVVFQLRGYPDYAPQPNSTPGLYQWPYLTSETFPFRVRGTQVRVMSNTQPALNAQVYRLPAGQINGAALLGNTTETFVTDPNGYLRGRGQIQVGDRLVALLPNNVITTTSYASQDVPRLIADNDTTTSTLTIAQDGKILDVNLVISGTHTWINDLSLALESPTGSRIDIMPQSCSDEDNFNLIFDDEAGTNILPCPPIGGGAYLPEMPLATFNGQNSAGVWKLIITDHASSDNGSLQSWGLIMTTDASKTKLYYTSASPSATGLNMATVTAGGVQTLTVSNANPLILFNLNVSLEWDARNDPTYLNKLKFDLSRTSEFLYDWTNGQMALGNVTIYQDREHWNDADIRLYGTNGLHPNADMGGIVVNSLTETVASNLGVTSTITYRPGQVRMAAVWSRFGGGSSTGEDWPRTLAHELAHYLLFQDDAYIGVNAQGQFFPLAQCANTAMTDPYREDYSEFKHDTDWSPACDDTLAARTVGRSEWATIRKFYPALSATVNVGPAVLPLNVTQIKYVDPATPNAALAVPIFYMTANGARYVASNSAKAILYQSNAGRLLDVGSPVDDRVTAYGAHPGDRLCVYDAGALKTGCEIISAGDTQLALVNVPGTWRPNIIATPSSSRTVELYVDNAPFSVTLQAQLYPNNGPASTVLTLTQRSPGVYSTTTQLANPALSAHVVVWVNEPEPRREVVSVYSIGGSPVSGGKKKPSKAPVNSNDGEVTLYTTATFPDGEFYALQRATFVPALPTWLTQVGPGYRIVKSPGAPSLSQSAIGFNYDEGAVPPGEENFLEVYYYQNNSWVPLTTTLDTDRNAALAPTQDAGLYVLVSSFQVRLPAAGWNLFAYPVQATRPITDALLSISGHYSTVYGYVVTDTVNPWRLYDVQAASKGYVNDLLNLEYGNGYWINVDSAAVLKFKGGNATPFAPDVNPPFAAPPATIYGLVPARAGFVPTAGVTLTAYINGVACGQAVTLDYGGQIVYVLHVFAEGLGSEGCGASGRTITVQAGNTVLGTTPWVMGAAQEVTLAPANLQLFLPLIQR